MLQAILPRPLENPYFENDDKKQLQNYHENQVETVSLSTINENGDEAEEEEEEGVIVGYDNAIVVSDQPQSPHFGTVSVVNSNDVHFGNKTVYKGPVTIKQFVYPKSDLASEIISDLNVVNGLPKSFNCDNKVQTSEGVDNGGFVREDTVIGKNKPEEREQETYTVADRVRKSIKYIKTFPCKKPKQTILLVFLIIVPITTISAILIMRNPTKIIQVDHGKENEEEDNNDPVDYTSDANSAPRDKLRMVTRINWLAQPPSGPRNNLSLPVSLVVIHHTATESCNSQARCVLQTRTIQTFHMESRSWNDIGYNFLIGGDGAVYEGRGWTFEGAHTLGVNFRSIGVAFIGTFNTEPPPANMLNAFSLLVNKGVHDGYLSKNYKVAGARQFSGTESPGKAFFELIKSWQHWSDDI